MCLSVCVDKRENAVKWWGIGGGNDSYFPLLLFFLSMKKRIRGKKEKKNGDRLIYIDFWTQRAETNREKKIFNSKKKKFHPNARNFLDFVWKIIIIRYCTYYPDNNLPLEINQKNIKERKK